MHRLLKGIGGLALCAFMFTFVPASSATELQDKFGRDLAFRGVTLVDWEGYMSNPAIELTIVPPPGAVFPATAQLSGDHVRLYFNNPSTTSVSGPTKVVTFDDATPRSFFMSIFPDRAGGDEEHALRIIFDDAGAIVDTTEWNVHVDDHDYVRPLEFDITLDFSQDPNGHNFLVNPADSLERAVIRQAADDWAYFIADMNFDTVLVGAEGTPLWFDDFTGTVNVFNTVAYSGFLLYPYGHHNSIHRSGGAGSFIGGLQRVNGTPIGLRRSGAYECEIHGNFNTLGWYLMQGDDDWEYTSLTGGEQHDLYSVAMHEIGHCIGYNGNHTNFKAFKNSGSVQDADVLEYLGHYPLIDNSDHLGAEYDRISLDGAYGNDYYSPPGPGIPLARWMITKLHILCLQAFGYDLRPTTSIVPVEILTDSLGTADLDSLFSFELEVQGGVSFYNWSVVAGALPAGLALDPYTGEIGGTPTELGEFSVTIEVEDYDDEKDTQQVALFVLNAECAISISGDVDESGVLNSGDIISLVNYVFKSGATPQPCEANGDVDCSGAVTASDVISMVNFVFKSGDPPCDICTQVPGVWLCQ